MTEIIINRNSSKFDKVRAYKIMLNGKKVETIRDGGNVKLKIDSGEHELYLKIDWCRSNKINFTIADGEIKSFETGSSLQNKFFLMGFVYITFKKNKYLWINEQVTN